MDPILKAFKKSPCQKYFKNNSHSLKVSSQKTQENTIIYYWLKKESTIYVCRVNPSPEGFTWHKNQYLFIYLFIFSVILSGYPLDTLWVLHKGKIKRRL